MDLSTSEGPDAKQDENPLNQYFARKAAEDVIGDMRKRQRNQWNALQNRGLPTLWRLAYAQAFGMDPDTYRNSTQRLEFCGTQQQFIRFRVQLARGHVKQRNQLAQGQRTSFRAIASNDNAGSIAEADIAGKVLGYLFRQANGEQVCFEALSGDGFFGEGLIWARWDIDSGSTQIVQTRKPIKDPQTGQPLIDPMGQQVLGLPEPEKKKTGGITYTALYPWEITRDTNTRTPSWMEIREKRSKYELMALYPEHAEELSKLTLNRDQEPGVAEMFQWDFSSVTDDTVLVHHFYHRNCAAVPGGRYIGYVGDLVLWDEPCPLDDGIPIVSICSARYFATPMGYPETTDLLAIQEAIDELLSQGITNALKFGNQNLWGEDGVEFDETKFMQGGAFFSMKTGQKPPETIAWQPMPEFTKYMLEKLPEFMEQISGMNSVVRGTPDTNIDSGVFASLMQSIAEKFISSTQMAYDVGLNELGNMSLELVRSNSDIQFAADISGDANKPYMSFFTAKNFSGVHSVLVERQSPVMNSLAGRFEIFEKTKDLPRDQRQAAVMMLKTGDDSAWTENDDACLILIRKENEMMARGEVPEVSPSDNPILHNTKHQASLDRLRAQDAPPQGSQAFMQWKAAIKAHVDHMGQHPVVWAQTNAVYAATLGNPPPPQMQVDQMTGQPQGFQPHPSVATPPPHPALNRGAPAKGGDSGGVQSLPKPAPQMPAQPGGPPNEGPPRAAANGAAA